MFVEERPAFLLSPNFSLVFSSLHLSSSRSLWLSELPPLLPPPACGRRWFCPVPSRKASPSRLKSLAFGTTSRFFLGVLITLRRKMLSLRVRYANPRSLRLSLRPLWFRSLRCWGV